MHIKEKLELQSTSMNPNLLEDRQNSRCAVRTLSSILDDEYSDIERIDLLKIDVEGSELLVLRGISKAHMKLIQQLVLEVHDVDGRLAEVLELLTMSGFDCSTESGKAGHSHSLCMLAKLTASIVNIFLTRPRCMIQCRFTHVCLIRDCALAREKQFRNSRPSIGHVA